MPHFMIILIPYINLLNLSWIIKCLFLRTVEPLNSLKFVPPFLKEDHLNGEGFTYLL